ncbi:uncharacterized protein [Henckelia pumila]|uniref:uncharacterized protein n=1 Tax=Henckelia pumila TaxID=405737 RepID=UPI003C6E140A
MGMEVMQPQDLLTVTRLQPGPFRGRKNLVGNGNLTVIRKGNPEVQRKASTESDQKKFQKGTKAKKPTSAEPRRKNGVSESGLVMGQVTLLRRGEVLGSIASKSKVGESVSTSPNRKPVEDFAVCEPDLIEPVSPLMLPKQIKVQGLADDYSGSTFSSSPSPRSVPVPSFFVKQLVRRDIKLIDDSASRDLRRLLRLDG